MTVTARADSPGMLDKSPFQRAEVIGDRIRVSFAYDPELVAQVRALRGAVWQKEKRFWLVANLPPVRRKLRDLRFGVPEPEENIVDLSGMKTTLYSYQKDGVQFVEGHKGRAIIGDEMGLGKTIQVIAWLSAHAELRPVVIVCPASLKLNWERELNVHAGLKAEVLEGKRVRKLGPGGIYIINYDILPAWRTRIEQAGPQVMVMDEVHYCKNPKAKRTKVCKALASQIPHVLALSGTPLVNRPVELFPVLHMISPQAYPSFWKYAMKYCDARKGRWGWDFSGASNLDELNEELRDIMVRRRKTEVLKDLPRKTRSVVPLKIDNRNDYDAAVSDVVGYLAAIDPERATRAERAEALVRMNELKRLAAAGKMNQAVVWIRDFLESGKKLVIFAHHKAVIQQLYAEFKEVSCKPLTGSTPNKERDEIVQQFQGDPEKLLFIGNMKAAGVGITLTAADTTCFVEMGWTPGDHTQAEDRVHRIGQQSDRVTAYYLIADMTIEEQLAELIQKKQRVLERILDGQDESDEVEWNVFQQIVRMMGEKGE